LLNIVILQEIKTIDIEFDKYNYLRIISSKIQETLAKIQEALESLFQENKTTGFIIFNQV
jgi:hypothetical protein